MTMKCSIGSTHVTDSRKHLYDVERLVWQLLSPGNTGLGTVADDPGEAALDEDSRNRLNFFVSELDMSGV